MVTVSEPEADIAMLPVRTVAASNTPRLFLKTILITAIVVRLAIVWSVLFRYAPGWFFRSQGEVGFLAQSLLAGHGFSSPFGGDTGPTAFLAPGYPALVALVFHFLGTFTVASAAALMLLQVGFNALTILLIVRIAQRQFGALAANLAGWFWAIGPPFIFLPIIFWETSLSILLLVAAIFLGLRCARDPRLRNWAGLGVMVGITLLVNPAFLLTLIAILLWAGLTLRRTRLPGVWRGPVIASLIGFALFVPWPIRNARQLHAFIPLRSNLGFELWKGNHKGSAALDDSAYYPVFNRAEYTAYAALGEVAFMRAKSVAAETYIAGHPARFASLSVERFVRFWSGAGNKPPSVLLVAFSMLTTILGAVGLVWLFRDGRAGLAMLFLGPLLLFPLPYYITHAETRFRLPIEPVMTLLAAFAIARWHGKHAESNVS